MRSSEQMVRERDLKKTNSNQQLPATHHLVLYLCLTLGRVFYLQGHGTQSKPEMVREREVVGAGYLKLLTLKYKYLTGLRRTGDYTPIYPHPLLLRQEQPERMRVADAGWA